MTSTPPRRVLIIVENLPVPFDTRVWNEATTLAAHGYEVSVICPVAQGFERRFEVVDGIFIYRHPLPPDAAGRLAHVAEYSAASYWQFRLAWRVVRERGFDVIHACNPPDTLFVLGLFFKLFGKRFIFDHHDLSPELYTAKFGRRDFVYKLLLRLERWTFRAADVVIATNESYRRVAIGRGGVDPERVWVVRSGPKPERMRILPPNPALRRGRKYLVGYVGQMAQQDGIGHLLEAARHIVHDLGRHDVHFHLVGSGPEIEMLREKSASLRVADYVTFAGRVSDDDLIEMLNTADVCVNPDDFNEMNDKSTMNKIMEYMALGRPIVQFETAEGRFSARGASLYARPNDARDFGAKIVELLGDTERCTAMGHIGRERVNGELAWSHQAPKLLAAYDAAFGSRARWHDIPATRESEAGSGRAAVELPPLRDDRRS
jgi:glycosyltransferase involved in cell wall biosynthesis